MTTVNDAELELDEVIDGLYVDDAEPDVDGVIDNEGNNEDLLVGVSLPLFDLVRDIREDLDNLLVRLIVPLTLGDFDDEHVLFTAQALVKATSLRSLAKATRRGSSDFSNSSSLIVERVAASSSLVFAEDNIGSLLEITLLTSYGK